MKRLVFKKWVVYILVSINMMLLMLLGSECESTLVFLISHIAFLGLFVFNSLLLYKYANLEEI